MPRLSNDMKDALIAANRHGGLSRIEINRWESHAFSSKFEGPAVDQLLGMGLLRREMTSRGIEYRVITPAGREAIGMKEGEDV